MKIKSPINRRSFLSSTGVAFLGIATRMTLAKNIKPNIILILADDMGYGDLSCINKGLSHTPHLDSLAKQSIFLSNAYSGSCVCAPARAALLTGRYPHRTNVVSLGDSPHLMKMHLDETTIADILRANGYATGIIGKWHCGEGTDWHPLNRGFTESTIFLGNQDVKSYFEYKLDVQGTYIPTKDKYLTDDLWERSFDFIKRHCNQPFFLHIAHYAPHRPLEAPREIIHKFLKKRLNENTAKIYAMIEVIDKGVGQLVKLLKETGLEENTILVFTSDNGPDPLTGERFNCGLNGTKYMVNEGGIKVPMLIRWPAQLTPGNNKNFFHFIDLLPTLVSACDIPIPANLELDGTDRLKALQNKDDKYSHRYWQWNRGEPSYTHNAAIREGDWKLVRPFITRGMISQPSDEAPRLYNLKQDPKEKHDLASRYPERVKRMLSKLIAWAEKVEKDRTRYGRN